MNDSTLLHDPGGKVRIKLSDGILGEALISPCQRYRPSMSREWTEEHQPSRSILWIGMNPSTADAFVSDPTCNRELIFSRGWQFTRYFKGNMLDFRSTNPKDLPHALDEVRSDQNIPEILRMATASEIIVMAYGKLHKRYEPLVEETIAALDKLGKPLMCLGTNKDGSAKHPLYLRKDTELQIFRPK